MRKCKEKWRKHTFCEIRHKTRASSVTVSVADDNAQLARLVGEFALAQINDRYCQNSEGTQLALLALSLFQSCPST